MILPEPWVQPGPPNDEIWYTSSDGNIVTSQHTSSLPTIVSNTYSDGKGIIKFASNLTNIGKYAFHSCKSLISVSIPNSVTRIEMQAFYNCPSLTSITIPDSVTFIGETTFLGCSSLTSITIPNSVTSIEKGVFYNCPSLTSVTIPNSVTSIGEAAFFGCSSLTSITIPKSVTSIGNGAFKYSGLSSISYTGTIAQYNAITKGSSWHHKVPATVVHCTDGDTPI